MREQTETSNQQSHRLLLETIGQLGKKMTSIVGLGELLPYIVELISRNFRYTRVSIFLKEDNALTAYSIDPAQQHPVVSQSVSLDSHAHEIVSRIIASGQPVLVTNADMGRVPKEPGCERAPRAEYAVPIVLGSQVVGVLDVESDRDHGIDVEERFAIQALADQIAIAVDNARLLAERERRLTELTALADFGYAINSVLDYERVSKLILDAASGLTGAQHATLFLKQGDDLVPSATTSQVDDATPDTGEILDKEKLLAAVESGRPVLHAASNGTGSGQGKDFRTLSVPLLAQGRVIGVIQLAHLSDTEAFDINDQRLLEALALPSSIALENARLYEETDRRLAEVSTLYTLAQRMTSSLDLKQMLDSLVVILRRVINCRGCCIFLLDESSEQLEIRAASGLKPEWQSQAKLRVGEGIAGRVVQEKRPIYIPDIQAEPDVVIFDPEVRSLLTVPMITKGKVIGTLNVDDDKPNAFAPDEGRLLSIAAAQAATIIENAQLYEGLRERARRLKLAYDELKELNRLKSEFVQNVSHELRTPLTFIRGYVDLLLDESLGKITEEQAEALHVVAAKTETLTRLVNDIISLQKAEMSSLDLAPTSLTEIAQLALRGAELAAKEAGVKLSCTITGQLEPVLGDRARLGQVLDNLIGNALKFTPAGGRIEISVEDAGDFERVSVKDSGIGIPIDKQKRVFEPFYQIDGSSTRRFGGAGLGLAIVRQIVEAHGGQTELVSEPGQGSTFSFTVPKYHVGAAALLPSEGMDDMELSLE